MEVYITVDTECREERVVRGQIRPPVGYDLMVRGRFDGYPSGFGADLLLRELGRYGFHATFFVEPLCAEYFGMDGLARVCRELRDVHQDVQLHLHPNFRRPEWRRSGLAPLEDNIGDYDRAAQEALLRDGLALLVQAGVPRSAVVAFRAGNYGASMTTFDALRAVGLALDSSFNLWALGNACRIVAEGTPNDLYEPIPGVWELPISCVAESSGYRHLEITAISAAEMRYALRQLHRLGARTATIVTHPAEFFVIDDAARRRGRPNVINIARLRSLLRFLDRHRDQYHVRTVGHLVRDLQAGERFVCASHAVPRNAPALRLARLPVQAVKRLWMQPRQA